MKPNTDTWYVLVDGTHADPAEVSQDKDGVLRHKNGVPVALRDGGLPLTSGVAAKEGGNVQAAAEGKKAEAAAKEMKPEPKGSYKTRDSKAG